MTRHQAKRFSQAVSCHLSSLQGSSDCHPQVTDEKRAAPQVNALHEVTQLHEVAWGLESGVYSSPPCHG